MASVSRNQSNWCNPLMNTVYTYLLFGSKLNHRAIAAREITVSLWPRGELICGRIVCLLHRRRGRMMRPTVDISVLFWVTDPLQLLLINDSTPLFRSLLPVIAEICHNFHRLGLDSLIDGQDNAGFYKSSPLRELLPIEIHPDNGHTFFP